MTWSLDITSSIRGKNALVTGGSSGIGKATVELLASHGANVALTYHHGADRAQQIAARCPNRVSCHFLNLRDEQSITNLFAAFTSRWGPLDILINNAAAGSTSVSDYEPDSSRADTALFEINAIGAFKICQAGIALLQKCSNKAPRKLINVASPGVISKFPSLRLSDSASKSVLVHLTKELAAQLIHTDIDVFAICPGPTNTPMFRRSTLDLMSEVEQQSFLAGLPKGRILQPEEIAWLIGFLASEHARALHGTVLDASMGLSIG